MATSTATVTITVECCQVVANDDSATLSAPGLAIADVRDNDDTCPPEDTTLSAETTVPDELDFDTSTGEVTLLAGADPGTYTFDYRLATDETFDIATVTVTYTPPLEQCWPPGCSCTLPC